MDENQSSSNNVLMGILSYLGILVIVPLVTDAKNDPFVKFHAKQGLVLLILEIIFYAISFFIPFAGVLHVLAIILAIMGIINVVGGKTQKLPVIGSFADNINL